MATYHPLFAAQSIAREKRKVWEDMLLVLERLGKPVSESSAAIFYKNER